MEIPDISIPEIKIDLPLHIPYQVLNVPLPSIKLPGCVRYHRDASPKNTALYNDDPTGTMISCPYGSMPTFQPLLYDRRRIEIVESKEQEKRQKADETLEAPATNLELPKEKKKIVIPECPGLKISVLGITEMQRSWKSWYLIAYHRTNKNALRCMKELNGKTSLSHLPLSLLGSLVLLWLVLLLQLFYN